MLSMWRFVLLAFFHDCLQIVWTKIETLHRLGDCSFLDPC